MKTNWTVWAILIILNALFASPVLAEDTDADAGPENKSVEPRTGRDGQDELRALKAELAAVEKELLILRKTLADVLERSTERNREYKRVLMSLGGTLFESEKKNIGRDEEALLEAMLSVNDSARDLVSDALSFCVFVEKSLEELDVPDLVRVRMKIRMDELRASAEMLNAKVRAPEKRKRLEKCRILEINDELQVILLSSGSAQGVFSGLMWRTAVGDPDREALLKTVAVRPFLSAAVLVKGKMEDLVPGMILELGSDVKE